MTKRKWETQLERRLAEEQEIVRILINTDNRRRLITRIKNDLEYAKGFKLELNKKGFLSVKLANFFYNINNYIESLVFTSLWEVNQRELLKNGKNAYDFRKVEPKKLAEIFWNYTL